MEIIDITPAIKETKDVLEEFKLNIIDKSYGNLLWRVYNMTSPNSAIVETQILSLVNKLNQLPLNKVRDAYFLYWDPNKNIVKKKSSGELFMLSDRRPQHDYDHEEIGDFFDENPVNWKRFDSIKEAEDYLERIGLKYYIGPKESLDDYIKI